MRKRIVIAAFCLLLLPVIASSATHEVNYTGAVTESGLPINGTRFVTLRVYNALSGGALKHSQSDSIKINNGVIQANVAAPDSIWNGADRWVGVTINGGAELVPRLKVGWVPYAVYTPRPSPILVFRPSTFAIISDQWTKVDSLTITASTAGVLNINATGFGVWAGPGAQSSAGLAISEATPTEALTVIRAISGSDAFSMTLMVPVTPGTRTYYVWGYNAAVGGTYSLGCQRFQALFIPN